jgi:HEAT repeat protein/lysophospholipase L1-like esterase
MAARAKALAVNLSLSAAVTVAVLGAGELVARAIERRMPDPFGEQLALWEKVWAGDFYLMHADTAGWPPSQPINPDGLADRAHPEEKPAGTWRVAVLGDSVTAGTPFKPAESWPSMLQARLDERGPWVEVMNVALWGWSTRQERTAFERIARRYKPDQVIVGLCLNDVEELQNNLERPPAALAALHRRSALVRRVVGAEKRQIRSIEELFADSPKVEAGFERLFSELRLLRDEVRAAGASFSVLVFPVEFQFEAQAPPPRAQRRIAEFCAREQIRCVDVQPAIAPLGKAAYEDLLHFNVSGRRLVAEAILAERLIPQTVLSARALAKALAAGVPAASQANAAAPLVAALASPDGRVRAEAAWALRRLGPAAGAGVPALTRALGDPDEAVRAGAARALGALGAGASSAVPVLLGLLGDARASVRWRAMDALWSLAAHDASAVPGLAAALSSPDAYVRAGAVWTLREIGEPARSALPAVTAATRDAHPGVRAVAVRAVARIGAGDAASVAALAEVLLKGGEGDDRWKAARALGALGAKAQEAVPALVTATSDANGHVRRESLIALGRIGPAAAPAAGAAVVAALDDAEPVIRRVAAAAAGRMRLAGARPALERRQADEDEDVRGAAKAALEAIASDSSTRRP